MKTPLISILLVLLSCMVGSFGVLFLKFASREKPLKIKKILMNKYLYISLLFYAISVILFVPALKWGELSVLYPLAATTYVWISLISMKFLKEKIDKWKWFGISIIILGIVLINLG